MVTQIWVGAHDMVGVLCDIGGWQLGCPNAAEKSLAVLNAIDSGYVGFRMHYANAFPNGVEFYEVTDKGIDLIRSCYGDKAADDALKTRQWYRDNTAQRQPDRTNDPTA